MWKGQELKQLNNGKIESDELKKKTWLKLEKLISYSAIHYSIFYYINV
jgi:hypothetical protein